MPCDSTPRRSKRTGKALTPEERKVEVKASLKSLEMQLSSGKVTLKIGPTGAIVFWGWEGEDRASVTDVCAYRTLAASNSWALRQAVAKAEAMSGKKVNVQAVASGVHSHDGGKTWDPGHK